MRKVVVTMFMSLDGVMEAPEKWSLSYWNDEIARFKTDELFASGAHLLGRVTYDGFAAAWPGRKDDTGFADRMNSLPKYVVSTTLKRADWSGSTIIRAGIAQEVSTLKQQPGGDILVAGSATLVRELTRLRLVDEYRFLVYPLVLGAGKRVFADESQVGLKLAESKSFGSGVVLLRYQLDK
ncbi:MAG: dihydrofolate reductase family protein [Candidatus Binatia bacterium]